MNEHIKQWIETTIVNQDGFTFNRVGEKHVLFSSAYQLPLPSVFIDLPQFFPTTWLPLPGRSLTESLFERLTPLVQHYDCSWFFVSMPQNEYTVLHWVTPWSLNTWNAYRLSVFENMGSEGGPQVLGLVVGTKRSLLVFVLSHGLEIAFYGPDDLWKEVSCALCCNENQIKPQSCTN